MTTCFLAPDPLQSTFLIPGSNTPGNGVQVFFYQAGTSTKQTAYKDNAGAASHTNPMVLDSGGNPPAASDVWFAEGQTYKVVYAPANDTDPPASPYRTLDNLAGINDVSSSLVEWQQFSGAPTFISVNTFTVTGDRTSTFNSGRRVKSANTGGTGYGTVISTIFSGGITTVVLLQDNIVLDAGLSIVYYATLNPVYVSVPQVGPQIVQGAQGRLSISANSLPSDSVGTTAIYWVPEKGNRVSLYDGAQWLQIYLNNVASTGIPAATGVRDVYMYNSSGTIGLTTVAWANDTTRSVNIAQQNGVLVMSGDATRLYMGTYWATSIAGVGTIPDTSSTRCIYSYWSQYTRSLRQAFTTGTWVQNASATGPAIANNDSTNAIKLVQGGTATVSIQALAAARASVSTTSARGMIAIGVDTFNNVSSSILNGSFEIPTAAQFNGGSAYYNGSPGPGLHTFTYLTANDCTTSVIWIGSSNTFIGNMGMSGTLLG